VLDRRRLISSSNSRQRGNVNFSSGIDDRATADGDALAEVSAEQLSAAPRNLPRKQFALIQAGRPERDE